MENIARIEQRILTLREVAAVLRCSRTHVAHVINGEVRGLPRAHPLLHGPTQAGSPRVAGSLDGGEQDRMLGSISDVCICCR